MKSVFKQLSTCLGFLCLDLWGNTGSSIDLRTTARVCKASGCTPVLMVRHGMGGSWKGEREEVKEEEERALDRCKEGADDGGEERVAEEAGGPHQVAQSC